MNIKERAFNSYVTSHVAPRKGAMTREVLAAQARRWDGSFGPLLPDDRAARIVDIGCGGGSVVWWLHQRGYTAAEGIDISAEQVSAAAALGVPNVCQADVRTFLAERPAAFDVIMARDIFEHFDRAELVALLEHVREGLKEGGVLIFQVPNAESPFGGRIRYGDITHELAFTASSVSQLMHLTGYSGVNVYPVEPPVYGLKSWVRRLLWRGVQAMYRLLITIEMGPGSRVVSQNLIAVARR